MILLIGIIGFIIVVLGIFGMVESATYQDDIGFIIGVGFTGIGLICLIIQYIIYLLETLLW